MEFTKFSVLLVLLFINNVLCEEPDLSGLDLDILKQIGRESYADASPPLEPSEPSPNPVPNPTSDTNSNWNGNGNFKYKTWSYSTSNPAEMPPMPNFQQFSGGNNPFMPPMPNFQQEFGGGNNPYMPSMPPMPDYSSNGGRGFSFGGSASFGNPAYATHGFGQGSSSGGFPNYGAPHFNFGAPYHHNNNHGFHG